jgi:hypothetical protein
MTTRRPGHHSEPVEPVEREHLAALKALRRAGLDPTVIAVRRTQRPDRPR